MAPNNFSWQEKLFYYSVWTKEMEKMFIEVLIQQVLEGNFLVGKPNAHSILCVMFEVNTNFNTKLCYRFCLDRVKKLKARYNVFMWIISLSDVVWNPITKERSASECVWDFICKENKLGKAYNENPEPEWDALCTIFGAVLGTSTEDACDIVDLTMDNGEEDGSHDQANKMQPVINISDSSSANNSNNSFWNYVAGYVSDTSSDPSCFEIDSSVVGASASKSKVVSCLQSPSKLPASSSSCGRALISLVPWHQILLRSLTE